MSQGHARGRELFHSHCIRHSPRLIRLRRAARSTTASTSAFLPTYGGLYGWEFEKNSRELHVRVEGQLVFNGTAPMLNAALDGLGLAYLPEDLVQVLVSKGELVRVLSDWCAQFSGYQPLLQSSHQSSPDFSFHS